MTFEYVQRADGSVEHQEIHTVVICTQHSEYLKTVRSKDDARAFWSRCELTLQTSSRTNTLILNRSLRRSRRHCEPRPMRVLQNRLQHPRSKQHIAEALEHQAEIEAETRVEEGTAAELTSQVETVINKDEMIDVIGCTRGHGFERVVTRWSCTRLPGKTHRSLRKDACTGTWHPARVQWQMPRAGQSGFHHRVHAGRSLEECNRLELRRWRLREENRLSEGTALERDGEAWSLADRTWVTT